ncbi:YaaC family protein [Burkholderia paludis]|uniref:YaaC family protein n=1 Tax=Burkholderia paludis TaxID=1506587 RepID=UPI00094710F1|nr:YaaC family protein [Burkholderia paludis]
MAIQHTHLGRELRLHKAFKSPDWGCQTVLVTSTWEYVSLWLKRQGNNDALFYWEQAKAFYDATKSLPNTSAPLTAYYCFLNAAKCLLKVKGVAFNPRHGVSGWGKVGRVSLAREMVKFQNNGILSELCRYYGEQVNKNTYSLKEIFYNLPFIHRAYHLTFTSEQELFLPISKPTYVHAPGSENSWFTAVLDPHYVHGQTLNLLPQTFERDNGDASCYRVRRKKRFKWVRGGNAAGNIAALTNYHHTTRKYLFYIYGPTRLWYLKRHKRNLPNFIERHTVPLAFAAMHRLSELARYTPDKLAKHLESQHNWLLSEFVEISPSQFIDEISSEITGQEFMIPGRATR